MTGERSTQWRARPIHINAKPHDFNGNDGKGRFLLLPGSPARAEAIAATFKNCRTRTHPRGHNLSLGQVEHRGVLMDVGVIATGMGCPSVDLIVSELIGLGARVLLRIGTSGSLQKEIRAGDAVVATAAVRDESTSDNYLPREFPALPSWPVLLAAHAAAKVLHRRRGRVHFGPVHTKDSLYARELGFGPMGRHNDDYRKWLTQAGVMSSEMECAHLFILAQLANRPAQKARVLAGGILAVIGDYDEPFTDSPRADDAIALSIELAFGALAELRQP